MSRRHMSGERGGGGKRRGGGGGKRRGGGKCRGGKCWDINAIQCNVIVFVIV